MKVSDHAVQRYQERVKPHLLRRQARDELEALVNGGKLIPNDQRPEWLSRKHDCDFVELSDGIYGCVIEADKRGVTGKLVATIVVRGSLPPKTRESRNKNNARQRFKRSRYRRRERKPYNRGEDADF